MKNTSLCYIENNGRYLMLLRNKKKNDANEGKWIGIGGKFEDGESPEECALREINEETGIDAENLMLRGIVTFSSDKWETEYMFLFTAESSTEEVIECNEGELKWIPKEDILSLNLWEGDKEFLKLLKEDSPFFSIKLTYEGEKLVSSEVKTC